MDCIGIFTTEYPIEKLMTLPEATTVDGIISLWVSQQGGRRHRRMEVVKLRGRPHLQGEHFLRIGAEGVEIIPRLEALVPSDKEFVPPRTRAGFGLPEFDGLMDGGLPLQSTTLLAGSMGIGKTLLAAHFAAEGARQGEKTLFVSFFEPPAALLARAQRIGLDVREAMASGALTLMHQPPSEREADVLVDHVLREVARLGVQRLVIDGLTDLELAIADPERRRTFLAAFSVHLRQAGVTSLFTKEVSKIAGTELDFSDTPIAILGENLLLLRYVELRGHIHRVMSILKMRDSKYDGDLREFEITDAGIRVLNPMRSAAGLLTGQAQPIGSTHRRGAGMSLVLIAEDEEAMLEIFAQVVEDLGHRTLRAHNGEEALLLARTERPDLVVSDHMMPRRTGVELLRMLRADPRAGHGPLPAPERRAPPGAGGGRCLPLQAGGPRHLRGRGAEGAVLASHAGATRGGHDREGPRGPPQRRRARGDAQLGGP